MTARHVPKIKGGAAPGWLIEHTGRNRHVLGPPPEVLAEWESAGLELPNLEKMRRFRLDRLRSELEAHDCDGALLYDPLNIRYATDTTNMPVWTMHNAVRYAWVSTDGPVIVFEFSDGEFLDAHSEVVDEIRPAISMHPFYTGDRVDEMAARWADELVDVIDGCSRTGTRRIAVDDLSLHGIRALEARDVDLVPGMQLIEDARTVKGPDEIRAMRCAVDSCERNIADMREIFEPGVTEVELWAGLQRSNYLRYGEWMETRIMASGARTNPWYHEASTKPVQAGEIMGFDTDMVGAYGMCVDMSRSWLCGDRRPSAAQADLFARARDMIESNTELFVPGATYRELTEQMTSPPIDVFNGYTVMAHGVGLCDEYPSLFIRESWDAKGFDGVIEAGNVMCVESFVGRRDGGEGIKLEEQVLITETGPDVLTSYPLDLV